MKSTEDTGQRGAKIGTLAAAVCIAIFAQAAPAQGAVARVEGSTLIYEASPGESNDVRISFGGGSYTITDTGAAIVAGPGCAAADAVVTCAGVVWIVLIDVALDDLDDAAAVSGSSPARSTMSGESGNDTLTAGDAFDNVLDGGAGADTLNGGAADDDLNGGSGGDELNGGPGNDGLDGGSGDDMLNGGPQSDSMDGGPGADVFNGGSGSPPIGLDSADYTARVNSLSVDLDGVADDGEIGEGDNVGEDVELVFGGSAADTLVGNDNANRLAGGDGNDVLVGGVGDDLLFGDGGDDTLDGGAGNDAFDGPAAAGAGSDVYIGGAGTDTMSNYSWRTASVRVSLDGIADDGEPGEGDNLDAEVENVSGGAGDDTLIGSAGKNALLGGSGDDFLNGGLEGDTLWGGAGVDTVDYSVRTVRVEVDLDGGLLDDGEAGEGDSVGADVENVTGGSGDDVLVGNPSPNELVAGEGDDELSGGGAEDVLSGGPGDDALSGGAGNDGLDGGVGADTLSGGPGLDAADYVDRTAGVVVDLDGLAGDGEAGEGDAVGADVENISGGSGDDVLSGSSVPNILTGGAGDDILSGGEGSDTLAGLGGVDYVDYTERDAPIRVELNLGFADDGEAGEGDTVGPGVEGVLGGAGDDLLLGGLEANVLKGGPGDDILDGRDGSDELHGGAGNDTVDYSGRTRNVTADLDGQVGDDGELGEGDTLGADVENVWGGDGDDELAGNASDNVLYGGSGDDLLLGLAGFDYVDYSDRTGAVYVDLDGEPGDDGESAEADTVGADVEAIWAGDGDDWLTGNGEDNLLDGGDGDDVLTGLLGDDELIGGPGISDTADYSERTGDVAVDLDGEAADDGQSGEHDSVGADVEDVWGGSGNDALTGNAGSNLLYGGLGDDVLTGLAGTDIADYSDRTLGVVVDLDGVADDGQPLVEHDNVMPDVDDIWGGAGNDILTGNDGANLLYGGLGADRMSGGGSDLDVVDYSDRVGPVQVDLDGQAGDDGASGEGDTVLADVEDIWAGAGNDTLIGNASDNYLGGGAGDDAIEGGGGYDFLDGEAGNDSINSRDNLEDTVWCNGGPSDSVAADLLDEIDPLCEIVDRRALAPPSPPPVPAPQTGPIVGTPGNDVLVGTPGNDVFRGLGGNDVIRGLGGDDLVYGGTGNDRVEAGAGNDRVFGEGGRDRIYGAAGDDRLVGGAGQDALLGQAGRDYLLSRDRAADVVAGGPGRDRARVDKRDRLSGIEALV